MYQEKINKWLSKMKEGKEGFQYWQKSNGIWMCAKGVKALTLDALYLCVRTPEKILLNEFWQTGAEKEKQNIQIVMKDEQKILIADDSGNGWKFGFEGSDKEERLLLVCRRNEFMEIIWATSNDKGLCHAFSCGDDFTSFSLMDSIFEFVNCNNFSKLKNQEEGDVK